MAGKYRNIKSGDGLNPFDFRPEHPKEIPFKIEWDGIKFSGSLTPSFSILLFGIPSSFGVRIPGKPLMNISYKGNGWVMRAPDGFVKVLVAFIEAYYE
jgi:hypothetical protein